MKITLNSKTPVEKKTYKFGELEEGLYIPLADIASRIYVNNVGMPIFYFTPETNFIDVIDEECWSSNDLFYKDTETSNINFSL